MRVRDLVLTSARQLFRQKRRYANPLIILTLAVGGVLTLLSAGDPVLRRISHGLDMLASATLLRATWDFRSEYPHQGGYSQEDVENIRALDGVRSLSPVVYSTQSVIHCGNRRTVGRILGVDANFFDVIRLHMKSGRHFTKPDVFSGKNVAVVGQTIAAELSLRMGPGIGEPLFLDGHMLSVEGLLGGLEEREFLEVVIVPISFVRHRIAEMNDIQEIYIRSVDWEAVPGVQRQVSRILLKNHPESASLMRVMYFPKRIEKIRHMIDLVRLFLLAALIVVAVMGCVSIVNCMTSAVQHRTTEIGLRKALGATEKNIQTQFLLESLGVSLTGTMLGVISGLIITGSLDRFFRITPDHFTLWIGLVAAPMCGMTIGIMSGWIPAAKAGKMDPVDAMRFE